MTPANNEEPRLVAAFGGGGVIGTLGGLIGLGGAEFRLPLLIGLFGFGQGYFGWTDPSGKVQLALVTSFILGIVASYKARG